MIFLSTELNKTSSINLFNCRIEGSNLYSLHQLEISKSKLSAMI